MASAQTGLDAWLRPQATPSGTDFPGTVDGLVLLMSQYLKIAGLDNFNGMNSGDVDPAPEDRSMVWYRTDSAGNPLGFYYWNGAAWVLMPSRSETGGSDSRPLNPSEGQTFFDSDIHVMLVWERGAWRTLAGSPGDVKEVRAETLKEALAANPGWEYDRDSIGMVVAGADDTVDEATADPDENDHWYGNVIGEEWHTLEEAEMRKHRHLLFVSGDLGDNENVGTNDSTNSCVATRADYNGRRDYSFSAFGTDGGNRPNAGYSSFWGGDKDGITQPFGVRQPTIYYWRLVKQ